jgi:hypothetical protein
VTSATILSFHNSIQLGGDQLHSFLEDDESTVRLAGWRLASLLGVQLPATAYSAGLRDPESAVASAALESGAWCGVPGVIHVLRRFDDPARPDRLRSLCLLAALGSHDEVQRIQVALTDATLGPQRFELAPALGSPLLMPTVLKALEDPDPGTAAAAGVAFARLTGIVVDSDARAAIAPTDKPDAFEAEFQDEVSLPDVALAHREWEKLRPRLEPVRRLGRGLDLDRLHGAQWLDLDMDCRRGVYLRAVFQKKWSGTMLHLERFPQCPPKATLQTRL